MFRRGKKTTSLTATGLAVAAIALAGGCTSDGGAEPAQSTVELETTSTTTAVTIPGGTNAGTTDEFVAIPDERTINDGGAVARVTDEERRTLIRTGALDIGQSPEEAERIVDFDLGSGLSVIAAIQTSDGTTAIRVSAGSNGTANIAEGSSPVAADDGGWLAWVSSSGRTVVIASASGAVSDEIVLDGEIRDLVEIEGGLAALVSSPTGSTVTTGTISQGTWTEAGTIEVSADAEVIARIGAEGFAVVSTTSTGSSVAFIDAQGGRDALLPVAERLVSIDFTDDGAVAIAVTDQGDSLWLTKTQQGQIEGATVRGAQW